MEIKNILIIIAIVSVVFGTIIYLLPYLKKKGVDVDKTMEMVSTGLDAADKVIDSLQSFIPNAPYLSIADKIIEYAQKGYEYAEQLNNIGKIGKGEEKKQAATTYVYNALRLAGIDVDDEQVKAIVDGSIEAAVYAGKSSTNSMTFSMSQTNDVSKSEE